MDEDEQERGAHITLYTFEFKNGTPASSWYTKSLGEAVEHAERYRCRVIQVEVYWDGDVHDVDIPGYLKNGDI